MLSPFTRDELDLLERDEFLRHASATDAHLAELLKITTARARARRLEANALGEANHQLIEVLDRFIATGPSVPDARVAQGLCVKLRSALGAAGRP